MTHLHLDAACAGTFRVNAAGTNTENGFLYEDQKAYDVCYVAE